jgi:hypothetical protein
MRTIKGQQVVASSSSMLAAVWILALSSIPSATSYRQQLDAGVEASKIITTYNSLSVIVPITMIGAWVFTSKWLQGIYDQVASENPTAIRLKRPWTAWGWLVPVVSLWFPKFLIDDLLKAKAIKSDDPVTARDTRLWWATWISFSLINNIGVVALVTAEKGYVPIRPELEIAGACMLTGSYLVWIRIIRAIGD